MNKWATMLLLPLALIALGLTAGLWLQPLLRFATANKNDIERLKSFVELVAPLVGAAWAFVKWLRIKRPDAERAKFARTSTIQNSPAGRDIISAGGNLTVIQQASSSDTFTREDQVKIKIVDAVFLRDYNGFVAVIEIHNRASCSHQFTEFTLDFDVMSAVLVGGPADPNLYAGVGWLPQPPFDVEGRRMTQGAVFFAGDAAFACALPTDPFPGRLTAHLFMAGPLQTNVEFTYVKRQLREHSKLTFRGARTWPPSWNEQGTGRFALGEGGGKLTAVSKAQLLPQHPEHLVIECEDDNGRTWISRVQIDDQHFLDTLYEKLRSECIGWTMNQIGSLKLPD